MPRGRFPGTVPIFFVGIRKQYPVSLLNKQQTVGPACRGSRSGYPESDPRSRGALLNPTPYKSTVMSHHHEKPEKHEPGASAHGSQVAVIDGNRLLCPCCGEVLAILADEPPEEPVDNESVNNEPAQEEPADEPPWQPTESKHFVLPQPDLSSPWDEIARRQDALKEAAWEAYNQSEKAKQEALYAQYLESDDPGFLADYLTVPIDPEIDAYEIPAEDPPPLPSRKKTKPARTVTRPPREQNTETWRQRKLRWRTHLFEEPRTRDRDRFLAWTFYHTKMFNLQLQEEIRLKQAKIEGLRFEHGVAEVPPSYEEHLPSDNLPKARPHVAVQEFDLLYWIEQVSRSEESHAHKDVSMAPANVKPNQYLAKERGPP
ncbi:hypothetical protein HOV93_23440 [Planctomycetes bacterium FF15]|uniref:Uncharacterized protein n=2 Tax=Bremerella alba TaxID=980252 RepID=A0A7V9A7B4_9BACT|nr:hypothetical protein [Bremerella alba]